jgi:zinc protease
VKNITLADIENYYKNYMTSMDAKVVVVGDIKQEEILPKLTFLNKLPKKKITLPKVDATPAVDKTKVFLVDVPKGAQTEFRVGYTTDMKYNPTGDYYKAYLANYNLGGAFNSRLNLNLREDKGWTYGAGSGFISDEHGTEFRFGSGIKAGATVMKEMKNYVASGITKEELAFMKSAIGQSDALKYETGGQKAAFIRRILDYNLPANYVDQQSKMLQGMTKEDLDKITKKYIQPERMNVLLVGDKAKIIDGVKKLGFQIVELDADGKPVGDKKVM